MSAQDILGQDEIDALINGAKSDAPEEMPADGAAQSFDFGRSARIVRGRMPTLEMINDRFARLFRTTIYNMLRRTAVVAPASLQFVKFSDYVNRLKLPTSLNLCQFEPLRGTGLLVLDPNLVFAMVREFSAIENNIVKTLLNSACENIRDAWSHIIDVMNLAPGDVLPSDFAGQVTLFAEDVPVFRGTYGRSGGQHALKVSERVGRGRTQPSVMSAAVPGELP